MKRLVIYAFWYAFTGTTLVIVLLLVTDNCLNPRVEDLPLSMGEFYMYPTPTPEGYAVYHIRGVTWETHSGVIVKETSDPNVVEFSIPTPTSREVYSGVLVPDASHLIRVQTPTLPVKEETKDESGQPY